MKRIAGSGPLLLTLLSVSALCSHPGWADEPPLALHADQQQQQQQQQRDVDFHDTDAVAAVDSKRLTGVRTDDTAPVSGGRPDSREQMKTDDNNLGFFHALVASFSVIIVSELGDKTFFIAAIMAMRYARLTVFAGAMGSLALMHVLSAVLGFATTVIPRSLTYYASTVLFALFGLKMLKEAWSMSPDEAQEEFEEAQAEIRKTEELDSLPSSADLEAGPAAAAAASNGGASRAHLLWRRVRRRLLIVCSPVFLEAFTLTLLAEWGDRSQIATILLAARENVVGVILGGAFGHFICTGLAVLGGKFIAQRISIRTVTFIGGVVFLLFALTAVLFGPEENS